MNRPISRNESRIDSQEARPRKHTRTRTGCLNCRRRKRKCDEGRPACATCRRRSENCEWGLKITFRAENALGIDGAHLSVRSMARESPPKEFEILNVTSRVIRDYYTPSALQNSDEEEDLRFDDGKIFGSVSPDKKTLKPGRLRCCTTWRCNHGAFSFSKQNHSSRNQLCESILWSRISIVATADRKRCRKSYISQSRWPAASIPYGPNTPAPR